MRCENCHGKCKICVSSEEDALTCTAICNCTAVTNQFFLHPAEIRERAIDDIVHETVNGWCLAIKRKKEAGNE